MDSIDPELSEKKREVNEWLETIYGGEHIPDYEANSHSLELLLQLKRSNEREDKHAEILTTDYRLKEQEYRSEADRIGRILHKLGMLPNSLSKSGATSLETLSKTASKLGTKDATKTNLLLGLTALKRDLMKTKAAHRHEQSLSSNLARMVKEAAVQNSRLCKDLETLEQQTKAQEEEPEKKAKSIKYMQTKSQKYRSDLHKLELELEKSGATPEIYHQTLMERAEELQKLMDKLAPLRESLDAFRDLPPDNQLAKVKVEEVRRELDHVEAELTKHISM